MHREMVDRLLANTFIVASSLLLVFLAKIVARSFPLLNLVILLNLVSFTPVSILIRKLVMNKKRQDKLVLRVPW